MSISTKKVIVIAGTTGVGKSQLSIQIASHFNGEVVNSDSMQVYKDIPIITNKHPLEEREGVPHHVINHIDWKDEYYLHRFEKECIEAIEDIHSRGKIPVVVGGTHYYLQALFNKSVKKDQDQTKNRKITIDEQKILDSNDSNLIFNALIKYDPKIADKYHPNDIRRVKRMLEIYYCTGKTPSETFAEQENTLRYDTLFLCLFSDRAALNKRLDNRVDKMLELGGMEEIEQLYKYYKENNYSIDQCENGVWQVIGFKEFLPWLEDKDNVKLEDCIERMKIRTRQYAKRQVKWIRNMLIPDINGDIYLLNATDLDQWNTLVSERALRITTDFVNNNSISEAHAPPELEKLLPNLENTTKPEGHFSCSICRNSDNSELTVIGKDQWNIHLKSRRHKHNLNRGAKLAAYEKWKAQNGSKIENEREN
ncbi:hypothetical protein TBLA_0D01140 [Henningerozyma blattae CBS 6284]|uniref:tRNA dimethylallyltransferase n=1 Tax=Henningerozyma blattae (strain ATCC 34711 / CBS 6284 / DSM 70876 / NBRC 10599 / NRRL Y-10934 / UCD 77-7) TaxID=1071380 RepID=I2H2M0_HENB6|nr:hypothetical protein TBLA_0D01140 [Tetrapisispora blattae CBS 6284]CCH60622.1 hypothetical protein TBLA_0D01140 [Tetrapisispora blattae CBS 6284]